MYRAKKKLGQNFLKDPSYLGKIIESVPNLDIACVEIGIGLGDLTRELIKSRELIAYEVDEDLCSLFKENFVAQAQRVKLIKEDVLNLTSRNGWLYKEDYIVVSNLPYYIATYIILRLLRDEKCKALLVMTQKEVAQKFCAKSKERQFCALSVLARSVGTPQYLFDVPPSAFSPAPKVISGVFSIYKDKTFIIEDEFEELLKNIFRMPRKKMLNNLKARFTNVDEIFKKLNIDEGVRAHELEIEQYHQLYKMIRSKT